MTTPRDYVSWSEISTWLHCQTAWDFTYNQRLILPEHPGTIEQQMGTAVHRLFEAHYDTEPEHRSLAMLQKVAEVQWSELIDDKLDLRRAQLQGFARTLWNKWGKDDTMPTLVTESPIKVTVPWESDKGYLCIPDAFSYNKEEGWGIIMSNKSRLSSLPDMHTLVMFHQQAPLEAWALRRAFNLDTVFVYINGITPTQAEREGPIIYTGAENEAAEEMLYTAWTQVGSTPSISRSGPHCYGCKWRTIHEALVAPGASRDGVLKPFLPVDKNKIS